MEKRNIQKLVLLSAGGTGGHVFPARALAEKLLERGYKVALATDTRGLKYFGGLEQIERIVISSGSYGGGWKGKAKGFFSLLKGYIQSHKLMARLRPSVVVGFGGYPSAPPLFAAQHRDIPTVLHEQNAILGMANQMLASRARKIALSAPETTGLKPVWKKKSVLTGNPVRQEIVELSGTPYPDPEQGKIHLMVVGGSQGAKAFADIIPYALTALPENIRSNLFIFHQARAEDVEKVKDAYEGSNIETDIRAFFDDMPRCIEKSHLLVTRSGASTVAELSVAGRPAIYIPFPWNRDYQQLYNAQQVASEGGALVVEEKDLTVQRLKDILEKLLTNPEKLREMAGKAAKLGIGDAAERLVSVVLAESD